MLERAEAESSAVVRSRVCAARERQVMRQGKPNAWLQPRETVRHCGIDREAENLLKQAIARLALSARGYHRVLRVARSIADLDACGEIATAHIAEAIQYRRMDAGL